MGYFIRTIVRKKINTQILIITALISFAFYTFATMLRNLSAKPFGIQLLAFTALCMLGAILATATSGLALLGTGVNLKSYQAITNYNTAFWVNTTIRMQIASTFCMFGLPAIAFAYFAHSKSATYLGFSKLPKTKHIYYGLAILIVSYAFVFWLAQVNKLIPMPASFIALEAKATAMTKALLNFKSLERLFLTIFYIGFLPAVLEELFFRACLQNILMQHYTKQKAWIAILITAVVFALLHGQMQTVLPRIFLGAVLGIVYYYSGSIWLSILVHFFNNALQVVLNYIVQVQNTNVNLTDNPTVNPLLGLASGVCCVAIIFIFYKQKSNYICHINTNTIEQLDRSV